MGGNIFQNAGRLDAAPYHQLVERLLNDFKTQNPKLRIAAIKAYSSKESFGDLDFLVTGITREELEKYVSKQTDYSGVNYNGPVVSYSYRLSDFDIKGTHAAFQVDFIFVEPEEFEFASCYFAYNDLGNLIGQTAAGLGLKFGHKGLYYKYTEGTELLGEICVTKSFWDALRILGYSAYEYMTSNFNTLDDIFTFAVSSKYFTSWNYQLENRNHVGRIRDKKRGTYMKFLEWMKGKDLPSGRPDKDRGILMLHRQAPWVSQEFVRLTIERQNRDEARGRFNGAEVSRLTGLKFQELGEFMKHIKSKYESPSSLHKAIISITEEQYDEMIKSEFKKFKSEI